MAAAACVAASGKTAARVACEVASAMAAAWLAQPDTMAPTRTRAPRPHSHPWMARDRMMGWLLGSSSSPLHAPRAVLSRSHDAARMTQVPAMATVVARATGHAAGYPLGRGRDAALWNVMKGSPTGDKVGLSKQPAPGGSCHVVCRIGPVAPEA